MSLRRGWIAGALMLAFGASARADYQYSSAITVLSSSVPAGDAVTLTGTTSGALTGSNSISLGSIQLTSAVGTPTGTATVNYQDVVTITNPFPGGTTNSFTINGTITVTNFSPTSAVTTNAYGPITPSGSLLIGNTSFTLGSLTFSTPTVNNLSPAGTGSFGASITATTVPEPGSMALIGIGLTGMFGYGWRRREVARRQSVA